MRSPLQIIGVATATLLLSSPQLFAAETPIANHVTVESVGALNADGSVHHRDGAVYPRVELFLGYSYLRAVPTYATGNRLVWMNGGSASAAFNLNRYLGLVADFGGLADSELNLTGPGVATPHVSASGGNAYTYLFGPRLSYRHNERITPFAQVLFGGIHASPVTLDGCSGTGCVPLPAQSSFAMTAGAGLDLSLTRHIAFRVVQAEYLMTRFPNPTTNVSNTQNDIRISSGLLLRFGGAPAPLPVSYSCSVSPSSGYPGDPMTVTGTALNLSPKRSASYTWSADGGKIGGTTNIAQIDTTGASSGSYTVRGHVSDGPKIGRSADCTAAYIIMAYQPPTIACSANPSSLRSGDSASITAQGISPQGRPLTYSYSASSGTVSGTSSSATLSTAGVSPNVINVTCNVMDDKGQSASATTLVTIVTPPQPQVIATQNLCNVNFARDKKRPTRVDNEAKACLDDIALTLQRSTDAKIALIGHSIDDQPDAAMQRAIHTRDYLVTDKGIDASRILIYVGPSNSKAVDTILIPSGAALNKDGLTER